LREEEVSTQSTRRAQRKEKIEDKKKQARRLIVLLSPVVIFPCVFWDLCSEKVVGSRGEVMATAIVLVLGLVLGFSFFSGEPKANV